MTVHAWLASVTWLAAEEMPLTQRIAVFIPCCLAVVVVLLVIGSLAFWIWCIFDVATREPAGEPNKVLWLLLVILLYPLGAILYLLVRRPERLKQYGK